MSTEMSFDPTSPGFNPHIQDVMMYYPDGSNLTVSLSDFNQAHQDSIHFCVIFATQVGACGILLLLVALLTQPEKRRTLLFMTNSLALVAVVVRSILQILYYLGPFFDTYSYIAYDWSDVPLSARRVQVAAGAMGLALQLLIEMSLILQVRVVYASSPKTNLVMTLVSSVFALTAVSFFFTVVVQNSRAIMALDYYDGGWIYTTSKALFTATICFYSLIFVIKLGLAIRQRRVLGLRAFGPLQIIFTVGCQTMILPALFSVIEHLVAFDGMSSLTPTFVAISLPLSAMWAAARTNTPTPSAASGMGSYQRIFGTQVGSSYTTSSSTSSPKQWEHNQSGTQRAPVVDVEKGFDIASSAITGSPTTPTPQAANP